MTDITWVETAAKTIDEAVALALDELGIQNTEEAQVEVLQQPQKGFLGMGGSPAMVRVAPLPKKTETRSRRRKRSRSGSSSSGSSSSRSSSSSSSKSTSGGSSTTSKPSGSKSSGRSSGKSSGKPTSSSRSSSERSSSKNSKSSQSDSSTGRSQRPSQHSPKGDQAVEVDINEQAKVVEEFLTGLLDAFGLEGSVATRVEDETVYADVTGDQTETLVGPKGSVLQSINELTRTVVQRKTQAGIRLRLDIAGYTERRREALKIYANRLADRVKESGEELMLEPMNSADRKTVHDAISEIDGVRTFSEGEDPKRYVVIAKDEG